MNLFFQVRRKRYIMDTTCRKRGRRLRECIVHGLNILCVGKYKNVQSQERRKQKEEVRGLRESLGLEPQFEEWKRNWP